jgi:serine/threonine protein phosphatase PrpC
VKCTGVDIAGHACGWEFIEPGDVCCCLCGTPVSREMRVPPQAVPAIHEPPFKGCPECKRPTTISKGYCMSCGTYVRPPLRGNFFSELSPREAVRCHLGMKHDGNDDFGLVAKRLVNGAEIRWLIVCDGLSLSQNAHLASEVACKAASTIIEQMIIDGFFDGENVINNAIIAAQNAVLQVPEDPERPLKDGKALPRAMTTITVALIAGRKAYLGWAGDSRLYAIYSRDGRCGARRLSYDDSRLNQLIDQGLTAEEASRDPNAQQMTQCLGPLEGGYTLSPHFAELDLENVAAVVAATDGAYSYFESGDNEQPTELAQVFASGNGKALDFADKLVALANERGGHDNITVAALFCKAA